MTQFRLFLLPLALGLAACSPAPSDDTSPATETAAAAPAAAAPAAPAPQVVVAPTKMIHAEPAALADCKPATVTLNWDTRKGQAEVKTAKIYTESGKLFVHMGGSGSIETGPWVKPGAVFILKNGTDDTELERLTIGGPICP